MKFVYLWLVFFVLVVKMEAQQDTLEYLFVGHTYDWIRGTDKVDYRLEGLDLKQFDQIWLGGDICSESAESYSTLEYLDDLFNLGDSKNHWTLGNHDHRNGNMEWIEEFTKRNDYYTAYQDGITVVVWNTNLNTSDCENLNKQYKMIMNVCDTIEQSSHLILLNHHNVWSHVPGLPPSKNYSHGGFEFHMTHCNFVDARFFNTIYPSLVEVQKKGVQVINMMGDAGWGNPNAHESDDGIWFMASGINATFYKDRKKFLKSADKLLVVKHIPKKEKLWWEYLSLDELYGDR